MDHSEAKGMHAAEKYVLGELSDELREEYEDHYLDCSECSLDVRAAVAFVANSKEVFAEDRLAVPLAREKKEKRSRWAGWLKPLIAVPAIAALVLALTYEKHHTTAGVPIDSGTEQTVVASNSFGLRGGDREASVSTSVKVHAGEAFGLHFDFTPGKTFAEYSGELQDQTGRTVRQFAISGERINKVVKIVVPGELAVPGNYALVIYGDVAGQARSSAEAVVAKYLFTVEIIP
jgi:hypothetical protein